MAVGRLTEQKGFDLLIPAFARAAARHPGWTLDIWGAGEARETLAAVIDASRCGTRIRMRGLSAQPGGWARDAAAFVLSSRWEGFPNVLGEAMACGLPSVAFDCAFGPAEMIRDGHDGLLVPAEDQAALERALDRIMGDATLRERLGSNAREIGQRLAPPRVAAEWTRLLAGMLVAPAPHLLPALQPS